MFSLISAMGGVSTASLDSTGAAPAQAGGFGGMWIFFIVFILIIYLFMIRPEKKRNKETQNMLSALKKGDKIVTIGGICGTIAIVRDNTVVVKVDDNSRIEFQKNAISRVVNPKPAEEAKPEAKPVEDKAAKKARKAKKEAEVQAPVAPAEEPQAEPAPVEEPKAEN